MLKETKLNKKILIGAVAVIAIALVAALAIFVPHVAEANKLTEQLNLGDKYLSELNYEQAVVSYLAVIEIDPKNVDAYLGLADAYIAQGEYDEAIKVLEDALAELGENAVDADKVKEKLEEAEALKAAEEATPTQAVEPTAVPTATSTPVPTATNTPTPEPAATSTPVPTSTPTPTQAVEPTAEPMATSTPIPTNTPVPTATSTPTPSPVPVAETSEDLFEWEENEDGTVTITAFLDDQAASVVVPKMIDGKQVTVIGDSAFWYFPNLANITLPDGLIEIEDYALGETSIEKMIVPESVIKIGEYAFGDCEKLKELYLPAGLEVLCGYPFQDTTNTVRYFEGCTSLEKIVIEEGNLNFVTIDGILYSKDMKNLLWVPDAYAGSYRIPDSVEFIGYALSECHSITELIIPATLTEIEAYYLEGLYSLERIVVEEGNPNYVSEEGLLFTKDKDELVKIPAKAIGTSYSIPDYVGSLDSMAFSDCIYLESVTISKNVRGVSYTTNSDGRYYNFFGSNDFTGCESLKEIKVEEENEDLMSVDGVLFSKDGSYLIAMPRDYEKTSYVVPDYVEHIISRAFQGCTVTEVLLPDGLKMIGSSAFSYCTGLKSIEIPEGVSVILNYTFRNAANLQTVILPASITHIDSNAFWGCKNLNSISIPEGIEEIGAGAFHSTGLISVELPEGISVISRALFQNAQQLKEVILPAGVTAIENNAFAVCRNLETVVISESVTSIASNAFRGCENLTIITPAGSYAEQYAIENNIPVQNQ